MIPYGKQFIDDDDINAVIDTLKSDFLTTGPKTELFEKSLAEYCKAEFAVVFNSGTSALHAAYFAAGLKKNDEFITSPNTFAATSNAGLFLNAKPVFCDIEEKTGNIDVSKIESKITEKTKLIVPVHYAGQPCDMYEINKMAKKHNLKIIEDACHAIGSKYIHYNNTFLTGSCEFSDMSVFSFHPVKHITTGEGGAVLTNNDEYYEILKMFRNHGLSQKISKSHKFTKDIQDNQIQNFIDLPIFNKMFFLGQNYRMTDIQASLGISQLKKLDEFIKRRSEIVSYYNYVFEGNEFFDIPVEKSHSKSSWHLYFIRLKDKFYEKRNFLLEKLRQKKIGVQIHYPPVYFHPYYQNIGYKTGICPNAEKFFYSELSLPLFYSLTDKDMNRVIETLLDTCKDILI